MLYLFTGTDRTKAREALQAALGRIAKGRTRLTITDAHTQGDLRASLASGGMFAERRAVVFEHVFANAEMREVVMSALPALKMSDDIFFILEEKLDAASRRAVEKYAEKSEKFDAAKGKEDSSAFAIANALRRGDKKHAWVALERELAAGKAPEMLHGLLFWAAKQMALTGRGAEQERGKLLATELAELPHQARRKGFELEYALEHFVLSRL